MSSRQGDWRVCNDCKGLFFGGRVTKGLCPADHLFMKRHTAGLDSRTFLMEFDDGKPKANTQDGWLWCATCEGIFFGGRKNGECPLGGAHDPLDSGKYRMTFGFNPPTPENPFPTQFRWCFKCEGMFEQHTANPTILAPGGKPFGGSPPNGHCPGDPNSITGHSDEGSGLYLLRRGPRAPLGSLPP